MSFETVRSTKAAVVSEVTEGTPVSPTSGSDGFVALQETGFPMDPGPNFIDNLEITGTLDGGAGVPAGESPTATLDHYFRMSGVEGTAPNYSNILVSMMGDAAAVNGTERTLTTGSTAGDSSAAAIVKLAAGGTDFARGKCVLLKDSVNGYQVRNVTSVATNDLTLAFNLNGAPASGVTCGKNIHFKMNNEGAPMTLWSYDGNGGAREMISGGKVNSGTFNFPANDAINANYSFAGTKYYFNPIEVGADNDIDFTDSSGAVTGTVTSQMYRDPKELADAVAAAMTAASAGSAGDTITCTYSSSTGKFTVATDGSVLTVAWTTAGHIGATLGFTADDSGSLTYTSDNAQDWSAPYTPVLDSEEFLTAKNNQLMVGTFDEFACLSASNVTVNFGKTPEDILDICQETAKAATLFSDRTITMDVVAYLSRHDITKWIHFKDNQTVQFSYTAGRKSSGNWVPGSIVNIFGPSAKISAITIEPVGSVFALNFTLAAFSNGGEDSFYVNML